MAACQQPQPSPITTEQTSDPVRVTVIGPQFCVPYEVSLTCTRRKYWLFDGGYEITDINQTIIFNMIVIGDGLHKKRRLLGSDGKPIVTISHKVISMHKTRFVYSGGETNESDMLFSLRKCSTTNKSVTILDVFIGNYNERQDAPDFRVQGSWSQPSVIYAGESSTVIAQTHQDTVFQGLLSGADKFTATVSSEIDYAFAVTLFLILADINHSAELRRQGISHAGTAFKIANSARKLFE